MLLASNIFAMVISISHKLGLVTGKSCPPCSEARGTPERIAFWLQAEIVQRPISPTAGHRGCLALHLLFGCSGRRVIIGVVSMGLLLSPRW